MLDVGTHSVKAGYAGDDGPKAVFPSACGVIAAATNDAGAGGDSRVKKGGASADDKDKDKGDGGGEKNGDKNKDRHAGGGVFVGADGPSFLRGDRMEVQSPFDADGQVRDWDLAEALWRHALQDRLRVTDPADMALMVVEPTHASRASREACVERLFESLQCPAAYLAKAALLASFATARQTGVVVDAGHMATTGEFFLGLCCFVFAARARFFFSFPSRARFFPFSSRAPPHARVFPRLSSPARPLARLNTRRQITSVVMSFTLQGSGLGGAHRHRKHSCAAASVGSFVCSLPRASLLGARATETPRPPSSTLLLAGRSR